MDCWRSQVGEQFKRFVSGKYVLGIDCLKTSSVRGVLVDLFVSYSTHANS